MRRRLQLQRGEGACQASGQQQTRDSQFRTHLRRASMPANEKRRQINADPV
jgi:hypothetical protein